eukprot:Tamp_32962.p2 GENE.Tamp_32962~~Tamp_32962.p2  ORF type:complete len:142 (-),score=11.43 Tamp_32962:82-507(-)
MPMCTFHLSTFPGAMPSAMWMRWCGLCEASSLGCQSWGYIHTTLVPMSPSPTVALSAHCDILKVCVAGLRSDGTLVLCSKRPWSCTSTQTHTHTCSTHARHGTGSGRQPLHSHLAPPHSARGLPATGDGFSLRRRALRIWR